MEAGTALVAAASVGSPLPAAQPVDPTLKARRGTHEPVGFKPVARSWRAGDPLPPPSRCDPPNAFGMCAWPGQANTLTYAPDSSLRTVFPADPKRWPEGNGGGAPSRWMWKSGLPPGNRSLYVRTRLRLSPNWTQRGKSMGGDDWNVGTKFFFPALTGVTERGDTTRINENNYVNLVSAIRASDCRDPATRCSDADWEDGEINHRLGLTFQHQGRHWGNRGADLAGFPVRRGEWFTAEFLLTIGDSMGTYDVWVNDSIHRSQPIVTPWIGRKGERLARLWWAFVWSDPTYGGGTALPLKDQWFDVREFYVSVR
jgi:hypothetical protein